MSLLSLKNLKDFFQQLRDAFYGHLSLFAATRGRPQPPDVVCGHQTLFVATRHCLQPPDICLSEWLDTWVLRAIFPGPMVFLGVTVQHHHQEGNENKTL